MTDDEIRRAMSAIARVAGLELSPERIERALPVYKNHLQAMDTIRRVELPLEAEPAPFVVPQGITGRSGRSGKANLSPRSPRSPRDDPGRRG